MKKALLFSIALLFYVPIFGYSAPLATQLKPNSTYFLLNQIVPVSNHYYVWLKDSSGLERQFKFSGDSVEKAKIAIETSRHELGFWAGLTFKEKRRPAYHSLADRSLDSSELTHLISELFRGSTDIHVKFEGKFGTANLIQFTPIFSRTFTLLRDSSVHWESPSLIFYPTLENPHSGFEALVRSIPLIFSKEFKTRILFDEMTTQLKLGWSIPTHSKFLKYHLAQTLEGSDLLGALKDHIKTNTHIHIELQTELSSISQEVSRVLPLILNDSEAFPEAFKDPFNSLIEYQSSIEGTVLYPENFSQNFSYLISASWEEENSFQSDSGWVEINSRLFGNSPKPYETVTEFSLGTPSSPRSGLRTTKSRKLKFFLKGSLTHNSLLLMVCEGDRVLGQYKLKIDTSIFQKSITTHMIVPITRSFIQIKSIQTIGNQGEVGIEIFSNGKGQEFVLRLNDDEKIKNAILYLPDHFLLDSKVTYFPALSKPELNRIVPRDAQIAEVPAPRVATTAVQIPDSRVNPSTLRRIPAGIPEESLGSSEDDRLLSHFLRRSSVFGFVDLPIGEGTEFVGFYYPRAENCDDF